ncbi:hypothetical protein [Microcoleus sp. M2-A5]|uniref:hypothetical protein n=1 Tax=Microcoleus sp. M2-A5 TaxID=2818816 RepID=UPI002FD10EF2
MRSRDALISQLALDRAKCQDGLDISFHLSPLKSDRLIAPWTLPKNSPGLARYSG